MVIPTLWPLLQRMGSPETRPSCTALHSCTVCLSRASVRYFGLVIGTFSLTRVICQPCLDGKPMWRDVVQDGCGRRLVRIIGALGDRFDFQAGKLS